MEAARPAGPARNLIEFARRARLLGRAEVSIVTFQRGDDPPSAFVRAAEEAGVPIFVLRERRRWDTRVLPELNRLVEEQRPDILQSHNIKSHFFVRWLGLPQKLPWVAFQHGYTSTNLMDRMYNLVDLWSLRGAFRLVAVCSPFKDRLVRRGIAESRIRIRHNPVQSFERSTEERVAEEKKALGLGDEAIVACIGR